MEKEITKTNLVVDQLEKEAKSGIDSLTSSVDKVTIELKQMIDQYNQSLAKIQQEIQNKEKKHAQKVNLVYQLKEQIADKQKKRQYLIKKNASGIKEIESLNLSIEEKKQEINKLKEFNNELESDCKTLLNTKTQLNKELDKLHQELSQTEQENKNIHNTKHDIDLKVSSVRDEIRDAVERLSMYEAKINSLKEYVGSQECILEKENQQISRISKEIQKADTAKIKLEGTKDTLQGKISNLVKTRENLSSDQRILDEKIKYLVRQRNDLVSTKKEIENSIINSKKNIVKSQSFIAKTTSDINKVTTINEDLKIKARELQAVRDQEKLKLTSLKDQLFKVTKVKEHALFDLEKVNRERSQLGQSLKDVRLDIKNKISEKNNINHQMNTVSAEIECHKLKLENAKAKVIKLQKNNKDSSVEFSLLNKELNVLRQQYIEETDRVEALENEKTNIENETQLIRKEIESLHKKYAYSKTYRKNIEHIIAEKSKLQKEAIFEKDGAESVVRYLGTDNMSAKALEKRLREKYVFLDVKANYLMSEIPLATIEKYEVFVEDFYNFALEKMDNNTSPMAIIKNYDNNMLNTSFTLFLDPTEDKAVKQTLERVEAKYGHKLQCFINRSGKKVTIDLFV